MKKKEILSYLTTKEIINIINGDTILLKIKNDFIEYIDEFLKIYKIGGSNLRERLIQKKAKFHLNLTKKYGLDSSQSNKLREIITLMVKRLKSYISKKNLLSEVSEFGDKNYEKELKDYSNFQLEKRNQIKNEIRFKSIDESDIEILKTTLNKAINFKKNPKLKEWGQKIINIFDHIWEELGKCPYCKERYCNLPYDWNDLPNFDICENCGYDLKTNTAIYTKKLFENASKEITELLSQYLGLEIPLIPTKILIDAHLEDMVKRYNLKFDKNGRLLEEKQ